MSLPVLWLEHLAYSLPCDPQWAHQSAEFDAKVARVEAGEVTPGEAFGPPLDADGLRALLERDVGHQFPRRYPLPSHWHWMGPQ